MEALSKIPTRFGLENPKLPETPRHHLNPMRPPDLQARRDRALAAKNAFYARVTTRGVDPAAESEVFEYRESNQRIL